MSFLPDINNGMTTQVYRISSRGNLRDHSDASKLRKRELYVQNAQHATVSAKRKLKLREELEQIKGNFENRCFKKGRKRRKSERDNRLKLEQYNWNKWLVKRNGKTTSKLTKREFNVFWNWYSSRREVNGQENEERGGIRLDRAADDFVKIGLFDNRRDACKFLKEVDTDHSGFISFTELMEALGDASNESQVTCMREFVTTLTEKDRKNQAEKAKERRRKEFHLQRPDICRTSSVHANDQPQSNVLPSIGMNTADIRRMQSC